MEDAVAGSGRNPVSKHNGIAEPASRDNFSVANGDTGNIFFPVQLTTNRISNLTRLIHTLLYVMTIRTYRHVRNRRYRRHDTFHV